MMRRDAGQFLQGVTAMSIARWMVLAGALLLAGCDYHGVGSVTVNDFGGVGKPAIKGVFDDVMYRRAGDEYTLIAYQSLTGEEPFMVYYRSYHAEPGMTAAELRVRLKKDGTVPSRPVLVLRQGDQVVRTGELMGEVHVTPEEDGKKLKVSGEKMTWAVEGARADAAGPTIGFELHVFNVLQK
jgi:hypothetical protein